MKSNATSVILDDSLDTRLANFHTLHSVIGQAGRYILEEEALDFSRWCRFDKNGEYKGAYGGYYGTSAPVYRHLGFSSKEQAKRSGNVPFTKNGTKVYDKWGKNALQRQKTYVPLSLICDNPNDHLFATRAIMYYHPVIVEGIHPLEAIEFQRRTTDIFNGWHWDKTQFSLCNGGSLSKIWDLPRICHLPRKDKKFKGYDQYDFIVLGISGGKDSTAALLKLLCETDVPLEKVIVVFADTGNEDPLTYKFIELLGQIHPICTLIPHFKGSQTDFYDLARQKRTFPSAMRRFCTQELKTNPSEAFLRALAERGRVLSLSGIRKDEGTATNDRADFVFQSEPEIIGVDRYRCIFDMTLDDVWAIHRRYLNLYDIVDMIYDDSELSTTLSPSDDFEYLSDELVSVVLSNGIPRNPLYDMGASRVGCFPCMNSVKAELRALAYYRPNRVNFIRYQEKNLRPEDERYNSFFHYTKVPPQYRDTPLKTMAGDFILVASIDAVVEWSATGASHRQQEVVACSSMTCE